jgi:antitoxin FitA
MPNVLVRDLPDDVHADLQQRAAAAGQSLQQYLTSELTRLARTPSMAEALARIDRRRGGRVGLTEAVEDLDAEREAR